MNDFLEYENILKGQIGASIFALVLIIALFAMLCVLNVKIFSQDFGPISKGLVNIFILVVIISSTVYFLFRIHYINQDINTQSYVIYRGEFIVSDYREGYVTLNDQNEAFTLSGRCDLAGGKYIGSVVYSQSSKYLLDWEIDAALKS
jgi:hypothetical protein